PFIAISFCWQLGIAKRSVIPQGASSKNSVAISDLERDGVRNSGWIRTWARFSCSKLHVAATFCSELPASPARDDVDQAAERAVHPVDRRDIDRPDVEALGFVEAACGAVEGRQRVGRQVDDALAVAAAIEERVG